MIYCDTSFLLALYIEVDAFHPAARRSSARFTEPIPMTLLLRLELENGIRRLLGAKTISQQKHDAIFRQFTTDESQGFFARVLLDPTDHFATAGKLSEKFTPRLFARSLDILHVAAARLLQVSAFASFDLRQRRLATAAGLRVIPQPLVRAIASA